MLTLDGDQLPLCPLLIPMEAVRVYLIFQTLIHAKTLFHSFVAFLVPYIFAFYFYAHPLLCHLLFNPNTFFQYLQRLIAAV